MNGRCETDSLDRAVDVCDSCYGEFCRSCLVVPRGRRHPLCTDCALVLSGVRGHSSPQQRGERGTVKQRRAELKAAAETTDDQVFQFFDTESASSTPAPPRLGKVRRSRKPTRPASSPTAPAETSRSNAAPAEMAAAVSADPAPGATEEQPPVEAPLVATTPAVARLEQLRRQAQPAPHAEPVLPPEPALTGPAIEADVHDQAPDGPASAEPSPHRADDDPRDEPKRRRTSSHAGGRPSDRPATAPMIGEVRTIGGRRTTDVVQPTPASQGHSSTDDPEGLTDGLNGVEQFDALQPAPQPLAVGAASGRADTDDKGDWIPPILRGIAPDAREAKTNLPQRRRPST